MDAMGQADIVRTGREQPVVHPMVAQIAFLGNAPDGIEGNGFIGTRLHTQLAADAPVGI